MRIHVFVTAEVAQLVEHLVVAQVAVGSSPIFRPIRKSPRFRAGFFFFCRWLRLDSPSAALCREPGPGVRKDKSRLYSRVHGRGYASFAGKGLREILFRRGGKRLARPACSLSSLFIDGALPAVVICLASERGPRSCPAGGGFSLRAGNALGLQTGRPCQSRAFCVQNIPSRSVAQHGSAPALGAGGRWFESSRSDHHKNKRSAVTGWPLFCFFCCEDLFEGTGTDLLRIGAGRTVPHLPGGCRWGRAGDACIRRKAFGGKSHRDAASVRWCAFRQKERAAGFEQAAPALRLRQGLWQWRCSLLYRMLPQA